MLKEFEKKLLNNVFEKYPAVQAVYLFGSVVAGNTHPESDIDLAVVSNDKRLRNQKLSILADLTRNGFCNVDLVFIDSDDLVLQYEAVRNNIVVYQTPEFEKGAVYSRIVRQYLDFCTHLSVQRKAYKRRILDG